METKVDHASFEQALLRKLSSANVKKDELKAISTSLKPFLDEGVLLERWKWRGIPFPDTLVITGRVPLDKMSLLNRMTVQQMIEEMILRKIGVVAINQVEFDAHIALNAQVG
ncbi:hypothetical protein GCM10028805_66020 [Spirosoma harenae]